MKPALAPLAPVAPAVEEPEEAPYEYELNLNALKPVEHLWTDRGEVLSCEGAAHPNHRHFKFKR